MPRGIKGFGTGGSGGLYSKAKSFPGGAVGAGRMPRTGFSTAPTAAGPTNANRFGTPALSSAVPKQVASGVPGVPKLSTRNRKSIDRAGF